MIKYISNLSHYSDVLAHCKSVKHSLWIGTADIKDVYIDVKGEKMPFLKVMAHLISNGVEINAKVSGQAFQEDFDKYKHLAIGLERVLCPRVHFKIIVIDCKTAYIGSANLTGAGMGMKSPNRRNFDL
ncbi:MAG: phospholipase D-like domain-containing protein [archaeon]|nr:phospholipase D-like domain-containing protein [archaeon]